MQQNADIFKATVEWVNKWNKISSQTLKRGKQQKTRWNINKYKL